MSGINVHKTHKVSMEDRFWMKVDKSGGENSCWPWLACVDGRNYGMFSRPRGNTKMIRANRQALAFRLGRDLLEDEEACHSCDNPICCNPKHLFVGSHDDNLKDWAAKGFGKIANRKNTLITLDQAEEIRRRRGNGERVMDLAKEFGIENSYCSRVSRSLTFKE